MNDNVKSRIISIIEKSGIKDEQLRSTLKKTFSELTLYEKNILEKVQHQVAENLDLKKETWDCLWCINTILVKNRDVENIKNKGFNEIKVGNGIFEKNTFKDKSLEDRAKDFKNESQFFLECAYEDLEDICQKQYKGCISNESGEVRYFHYSLIPHYRFIKQEELLFKTADLYKIIRPVVFSPYARRAVDIRLDDVSLDEFIAGGEAITSLMLEDNGLKDILLTDCRLMWNVEIEDGTEVFTSSFDDSDSYQYLYFYDPNEESVFIYPRDECDSIYKKEDRIEVNYHDKAKSDKYEKVTIKSVDDEDYDRCFVNEFDYNQFEKEITLRTVADINNVLTRFRNKTNGFHCRFAQIMDKHQLKSDIIRRYKKEHSYLKNKNDLYAGALRYKPCCCIDFYGNGVFLTDYANYVLYYMEQNYPEFNWIGKLGR